MYQTTELQQSDRLNQNKALDKDKTFGYPQPFDWH